MAGKGIEELADEVERQPEVLQEFSRAGLPKAPAGSIFVGAGDSYAAALAGFYASKGRCIALDPYSLASTPDIARGREVFLISVSGRTASNLLAARKVRGIARETFALTADEGGKLAGLTGKVVKLPMTYAPRTSGMLSFSLSLLAVLRISGEEGACDFHRAIAAAKGDAGKAKLARETTYFLGNSLAYAIALYAAAKSYELVGSKAHAELLEEFSHLELFSLTKADSVDIFSCFDPSGMGGKLARALRAAGFEGNVIPARGDSDLARLFHSVFVAQLMVVEEAKSAGISRPNFLGDRNRLGVSDAMIY